MSDDNQTTPKYADGQCVRVSNWRRPDIHGATGHIAGAPRREPVFVPSTLGAGYYSRIGWDWSYLVTLDLDAAGLVGSHCRIGERNLSLVEEGQP